MPPFTKLGEYTILEELGKGGMGVVYKARQESLDRLVALKVLPDSLVEGGEFVKRFVREAKAAAHMVHPNVIQIYSVGEDQGVNYYAMEFVEGEDLSRRLRGSFHPTWEEATDLVTEVAKALSCAEDAGIVHRDIKPANIMIDKRAQVKVMDFGLAKAFSEQTVMVTQPGMVVGTVAYMSPEQGKGDELDGRADQYSLGVVYYELLTGRLPFKGDSPTSVIYMHIHEPPPPPRSVNPTIPEAVERVVLRMLAKKREERYPNAKALIQDLKAAKRDAASGLTRSFAAAGSAPAEADTDRTVVLSGGPGPVRERKGFVWVGASAAMLLAGAAYVGFFREKPQGPAGDGQRPVPASPEKVAVDLGKVLGALALQEKDQVSLNGQPIDAWQVTRDMECGGYEIVIKRRYHKPEVLQIKVVRGKAPELSSKALKLEPEEREVLEEVVLQLAASEKDGDPLAALKALDVQDEFVKRICKSTDTLKGYRELRDRHWAYWKARQYEAEGKLPEAEKVLSDARSVLDLREKDYLLAVQARLRDVEKAVSPPSGVGPGRPDTSTSSREFSEVIIDFVLPRGMPKETVVFFDSKPLQPGPPWKASKVKEGRHQIVLQAPFFKRLAAEIRVNSEGAPSLVDGKALRWEPDVPLVLQEVKERLGRAGPAADKPQRLENVNAARVFVQGIYETAGAAEIGDEGLRKLLDGQEAYLRAEISWQGGQGNAQEVYEILAQADGRQSLDREGLDLFQRVKQAMGQQEMAYLIGNARDRVSKGLLDADLDQALASLRKEYGKYPEIQALQAQVGQAKLLLGEVNEMESRKQYILAAEKLGELILQHCPQSSVLKARLADIERKRESDIDAQADKKKRIDALAAQLEEARRKGDPKEIAEAADKILALDPSHREAASHRAEAERQMFEAGARSQIDGRLDRLTHVLRKAGGLKDKDDYQGLFTAGGWALQVQRNATRFFDSPLVLVSSQFNNAVTELDLQGNVARTSLDWLVAVKYGTQEIQGQFPLLVEWRLASGVWKINSIEEKAK